MHKTWDLIRPTVVLVIVCVVISGLLALTYNLTGVAELSKAGYSTEQLSEFAADALPGADQLVEVKPSVEDDALKFVYKAENGAGMALVVITKGYSEMTVMYGFDVDGILQGVHVITQEETPGIGDKVVKDTEYLRQFAGQPGGNIAVDVVRAIRADAYIRPNEGRRKVYVFPDCALLTEQDQNVLLKVVEEGPPYAACLFCAENAAVVLQTLRSRCVELKLHPAAEGGGEEVQAAEALCRCLAARKRGKVTELAVRLEKKRITREDLSALLERSRALCAAALLLQYGQEPEESCREIAPILAKNLTKSQIMRTIERFQKYRGECTYNVGTGHVLGAIAVELEGIL